MQEALILRIAEFAKGLVSEERANLWFFVRYDDDFPHVRLRFRINPAKLYSDALPVLCNWANALLLDGACSNVRFETYNREIERYGGPTGMLVAESLFFIDSEFVSEWFRVGSPSDTEIFAILSLKVILQAFGLDAASMMRLLEAQNYGQPTQAAGQRFRETKQLLRTLLLEGQRDCAMYPHIFSLCEQFGSKIASEAGKFGGVQREEFYFQFLDSFVHMHFNRLYGINNLSESDIRDIFLRALKMLSFLKTCA